MHSASQPKVHSYTLHYGLIAGISYYNAVALRQAGVPSRNVILFYNDLGGTDRQHFDRRLPYDASVAYANEFRLVRRAKLLAFALEAAVKAGLVHYYSNTILPGNLDAALFRTLGKPMLISWAGGDVRIVSLARKNNPYFYGLPDEERDRQTRARLERLARSIRYVATDPEMAEYSRPYFEKVFIVPQPIDLAQFKCVLPEMERPPVVLHIPTHRERIGTDYIEAAVERLKSEGVVFEFRLLAPMLTQNQVREQIGRADIYVNELRCGSYGITCVEALASGKPTLTYIREDLVSQYPPDLPVVNANPDTVYARLKGLLLDTDMRRDIGTRSRAYAEKHHALPVIAARLVEIYREIGWRSA